MRVTLYVTIYVNSKFSRSRHFRITSVHFVIWLNHVFYAVVMINARIIKIIMCEDYYKFHFYSAAQIFDINNHENLYDATHRDI